MLGYAPFLGQVRLAHQSSPRHRVSLGQPSIGFDEFVDQLCGELDAQDMGVAFQYGYAYDFNEWIEKSGHLYEQVSAALTDRCKGLLSRSHWESIRLFRGFPRDFTTWFEHPKTFGELKATCSFYKRYIDERPSDPWTAIAKEHHQKCSSETEAIISDRCGLAQAVCAPPPDNTPLAQPQAFELPRSEPPSRFPWVPMGIGAALLGGILWAALK